MQLDRRLWVGWAIEQMIYYTDLCPHKGSIGRQVSVFDQSIVS